MGAQYTVEIFDTLPSTNEYVRQLAEAGAPSGTAVLARHQTDHFADRIVTANRGDRYRLIYESAAADRFIAGGCPASDADGGSRRSGRD